MSAGEDSDRSIALARIVAGPLDVDIVDGITRDELRNLIAARLRVVIDHQFSRLAQILYQVDVDESRVAQVFNSTPVTDVPEALADLIIERSLLRLELRRRVSRD